MDRRISIMKCFNLWAWRWGGGATEEMLESIKRFGYGLPGSPKTRTGTVREFFEKLDRKVRGNRNLPKWAGELYFERHRGTYTSMARNKSTTERRSFSILRLSGFPHSTACFSESNIRRRSWTKAGRGYC